MAATLVSKQTVTMAGLVATYSAADATNGNLFQIDDGNTFLHVKNGGGGTLTVTFDVTETRDIGGVSVPTPDVVGSVAAGGEEHFGPFPMSFFNQGGADQGKCKVTWSTGTSVTFAVLKL